MNDLWSAIHYLRVSGKITKEECKNLLKKLSEHNKHIKEKVIADLQEQNKWRLCSEELPNEYGYYLCQLKGTRDEVIDRFMNLCDSYCHFNANKHPSNGYVISRASLLDIAEKMKGEQNE